MRRLSSSMRMRSLAVSMPMLTVQHPARFSSSTLRGSLTSMFARTLQKKGRPTCAGHFSASSSSQSFRKMNRSSTKMTCSSGQRARTMLDFGDHVVDGALVAAPLVFDKADSKRG